MQRAECHARRRNLLDLGPQDCVTQLVYVHQLYFHGMRGPEWDFRRSVNVRDRSNRLRELPRREEGRAPFPSSSYHLNRAFPFRSTLRFVRARRADAASPPNPNHNPDTVLATPAARPHHYTGHDGGNGYPRELATSPDALANVRSSPNHERQKHVRGNERTNYQPVLPNRLPALPVGSTHQRLVLRGLASPIIFVPHHSYPTQPATLPSQKLRGIRASQTNLSQMPGAYQCLILQASKVDGRAL